MNWIKVPFDPIRVPDWQRYQLLPEVLTELREIAGPGDSRWWINRDGAYACDRLTESNLRREEYSWGWTLEHDKERYYKTKHVWFLFLDPRHATYFKLKWGGK